MFYMTFSWLSALDITVVCHLDGSLLHLPSQEITVFSAQNSPVIVQMPGNRLNLSNVWLQTTMEEALNMFILSVCVHNFMA